MAKVKSKGIPPHVIAKLDLPEPPEGLYWKLIKKDMIGSSEVQLMLPVKFFIDKRVACNFVSRIGGNTIEQRFRTAAVDCIATWEFRKQVDKLWEK